MGCGRPKHRSRPRPVHRCAKLCGKLVAEAESLFPRWAGAAKRGGTSRDIAQCDLTEDRIMNIRKSAASAAIALFLIFTALVPGSGVAEAKPHPHPPGPGHGDWYDWGHWVDLGDWIPPWWWFVPPPPPPPPPPAYGPYGPYPPYGYGY